MTTIFLIVRFSRNQLTNITTMNDDKQIREMASQMGRVAGAIKVLKFEIELNQIKEKEELCKRLNDIYKFIMLPASQAYDKTIN